MGCCVSTNRASRNTKKDQIFQVGSDQSLKSKALAQESRAPPPDEETVKEVLSETPNFKPQINNSFQERCVQEPNKENRIHIDRRPFFDDEKRINNKMFFREEDEEEDETNISEQEVSEVCSLSMSETLSTTTFNNDNKGDKDCDNDDDGEEVKQRVKRSPVSRLPRNRPDFGPTKERVVGKSPTRRTEQSPDKRHNGVGRGGGVAVRMVQSKESGNYQGVRKGLRPDPTRKDPSEGSGRRSKSPATNRSLMGRSPSARRANGSPSRFRTDREESGGRVGSGVESKWSLTSSNVGGSSATTPVNESLENPLVSLECFIFL